MSVDRAKQSGLDSAVYASTTIGPIIIYGTWQNDLFQPALLHTAVHSFAVLLLNVFRWTIFVTCNNCVFKVSMFSPPRRLCLRLGLLVGSSVSRISQKVTDWFHEISEKREPRDNKQSIGGICYFAKQDTARANEQLDPRVIMPTYHHLSQPN